MILLCDIVLDINDRVELSEALYFTNKSSSKYVFVKTEDGAQNNDHFHYNIPFSEIFNFT
jgi:hypothetical protein